MERLDRQTLFNDTNTLPLLAFCLRLPVIPDAPLRPNRVGGVCGLEPGQKPVSAQVRWPD